MTRVATVQAGLSNYEDLKKQLEESNSAVETLTAATAATKIAGGSDQKYSYSKLMERPPGVDPTCLENYMLEEEFPKVFGMSYADFMALPKWKRDARKKEKKLF